MAKLFANSGDPDQMLHSAASDLGLQFAKFVCVKVLRPSQSSGVMSSAVSLPNHTFTGQA